MKLPHEKEIVRCEEAILSVKTQNKKSSLWSKQEIGQLEKKLENLKKKVYSNLTPGERLSISRHPMRPHTMDYIENITTHFEEIFGDRLFGDDPSMVTGFSKIDNKRFIIIGLEKGKDTDSRLKRNFGMSHPEGYRKALKAMKLAEKFDIPVISFLDTPGAYPGLSAEERGQGWAIAKNLFEMSKLKVPIIVLLIGEGCSGGALGIGVGDIIGMLEHSYYSVISPEGCASILWKDSAKNAAAAKVLKMQAEDMLKFNVIDEIIKEPLGGAHHDTAYAYKNIKNFILKSYKTLKNFSKEDLLLKRYERFRKLGEVFS